MAKPDKTEENPHDEVTTQLPSAKKLKDLSRAYTSATKESQSIMGAYREKVGEMVENGHLHKKAWSACMSESKMSPEQLAEFYEHQDHYREVLGLNARAASAPRMEMGDNVVDLPQAAE